MTRSPLLWGIGLACALGGAIAGNALGSIPITDRSVVSTFYQSHETAVAEPAERGALPDHYPLVTRNGVVPVAELSDRGLFSQARYRVFRPADAFAFETAPDPRPRRGAGEPIDTQKVEADGPAPLEPLEMAHGPAQLTMPGKIIDVQAALAMR